MENNFVRKNLEFCPFCGGALTSYYTLTSRFFSERACKSAHPTIVSLLSCASCQSMLFDADFTKEQMQNLYDQYRGNDYFIMRNKYEPWYTDQINKGIGDEKEFDLRRKVLIKNLDENHIFNNFKHVLDHGGDKGQMISPSGGLNAEFRAVCELSGVDTEEGVTRISQEKAREIEWDLILSCHVIEHLPDPFSYLKDILALGNSDTTYFFEVPYEKHIISYFCSQSYYVSWLNLLAKHEKLMMLFDFYSVVTRKIFKRVFLGGFTALREHLQFFTVKGFSELLNSSGFKVVYCSVGQAGHIIAIAKKK